MQSAPPDRSQEILWVDEGSVRSAAEGAARRGAERDVAQPASTERPRRRRTGALSPDTVGAVERRVGPRRAEKLTPILLEAQVALDRERFGDARRIAASLLPELSKVAEVHEVIGLAAYRLGRWREAANALEASRALGGPPEDMPVLADCYRALRRYAKVDEIWAAIRASSPSPAVMAEGRIVAAGALADRGDLAAAIRAMGSAGDKTRRVREHHLRSWYFLADLYDRSGDALAARELFARVVAHDAEFADVQDRLRALGR